MTSDITLMCDIVAAIFWLEGGPARKAWLRSGGASVLWPSSPSSSEMSVKMRWSLSLLLSLLCSRSPLTALVWGEMDFFWRQNP